MRKTDHNTWLWECKLKGHYGNQYGGSKNKT